MRVLHFVLAITVLFSTIAYANDSKILESIAMLKQDRNVQEKSPKLLFEEKLLKHTFSHSGGLIYSESYWDKMVKRVIKASMKSIHEREDLKDRPIWIETYNTGIQKGVFFENFEKRLKTELVSRGYHVAPEKRNNAIVISYGIEVAPAVSMMKKWNILFTANIVSQNHYVMHVADAFVVTNNSATLYITNIDSVLPVRNTAARRISITGK
ncbi:MAG: hypothetical protein ACRCV3_01040 [Desulfovibrionaceae bacterium]